MTPVLTATSPLRRRLRRCAGRGGLTYHELQGFLFALASCPDMVLPSEWMPIVFGDGNLDEDTLAGAQEAMTELMGQYNAANAAVTAGTPSLPADVDIPEDVLAAFEPEAPIGAWCRGFIKGHTWLEESWEDVPGELEEEFSVGLIVLSFFGSSDLARDFAAEVRRADDFEGLARDVRDDFQGCLHQYAVLGRAIGQAHDTAPPAPPPRAGRNEPCPCGSGKKQKRCCGAPA